MMMQYEMFNNSDDLIPVARETKRCTHCKKDLPATEVFFHPNTQSNGKKSLKNFCRSCDRKAGQIVARLRKTAPPVSSECDCCGRSLETIGTRDIHLDHCKDTETFRGWLCKNCNIGLGMLGDDMDGIEKALAYLKRWEDKHGTCKKE